MKTFGEVCLGELFVEKRNNLQDNNENHHQQQQQLEGVLVMLLILHVRGNILKSMIVEVLAS